MPSAEAESYEAQDCRLTQWQEWTARTLPADSVWFQSMCHCLSSLHGHLRRQDTVQPELRWGLAGFEFPFGCCE